ncbi:hypothetical protein D3C72_759550 [compost metagenome]
MKAFSRSSSSVRAVTSASSLAIASRCKYSSSVPAFKSFGNIGTSAIAVPMLASAVKQFHTDSCQ